MKLFRFLLYALVFASSGTQLAVVPILPVYAHRLGLSGLQQGALLSATGLATLAFPGRAEPSGPRWPVRACSTWVFRPRSSWPP